MSIALSLTLMLRSPEPSPIAEPDTEPAPLEQPREGGFGTVTTVTTDSNVVAPPPSEPEPDSELEDGDEPPERELSLRAVIGYGQVDLGNPEALDHQGASLRAQFAMFPWISKSGQIAVGIGLVYGYQGLNRKPLPDSLGFNWSKGQQQAILLSLPLLFRPDRQWFSIQPSGLIGLGFYTGTDLLAGNQRSKIAVDDYAFAAGGDLALCSVWDIVCVVGGAQYLVSVEARARTSDEFGNYASRRLTPWGWHVGLGVDVLRIIQRGNRVD